ncbi:hypothetical protein TSUD_302340 [Trifolium subterraneum]|uniref:Aminotransferase-like plant mobile domain-containing protein n=1 Tax=Trifolium subterraneum TaxID=3900 RepID=A0A2Z6NIE8_TRISU|nr:hypothetical protein TSUD_302340 [Trifolium subterraneum]
MQIHIGILFAKCTEMKMYCVVRPRGRDDRIRHAGVGREVSVPVEHEQDIEQPVMQEDVVQHGWPGGPLDTSLLMCYEDHVARYIWFGQERIQGPKPELRLASLGAKLIGWVPGPGEHHRSIQGWVDDFGLKWLERTSLTVSMEGAATLAAELLGVPYEEALIHTSEQRGGSFTQQWLYECWQRNIHMYHIYDCAARAYLLLLVGCTILTDKTYTRVNAKWLPMFRDLFTLNRFSWASAALVCLYDNLNDASMFATHALAGYTTLLQCWIHEYFPTLGRRGESVFRCDKMGYLRAMRWIYKQGKTKLPVYRPNMDALTPVVPYLPERCLRQFGFVQYIPPPPHAAPSYVDIDRLSSGYHASVDRILQPCRPHDGPHGAPLVPQFVPAYAPPEDDLVPEDAPPTYAPPESSQQGERRWRYVVVSALERFITHVDVDRDNEIFEDFFLHWMWPVVIEI